MGAIEELAAALLGQGAQTAIQAENPYSGYGSTADQFSNLITQAAGSGKYKTNDVIVPALLSGLTSGIFKGLGESRQSDLTSKYQDVATKIAMGEDVTEENSNLPPSLFRKAKDAQNIFKLQTGLQENIDDRKLDKTKTNAIDVEFASAIAKNPERRAELLRARDEVLGLSPRTELRVKTPEEVAAEEAISLQQSDPLGIGRPSLQGMREKLIKRAMADGSTRNAAGLEADRAIAELRGVNKAALLDQQALIDRIATNESLSQRAQGYVNRAGDTGAENTVEQPALYLGSVFSDAMKDKYIARKDMESLSADVIKQGYQKGSAGLSQKETEMLLRSGVQPSNPKETNQQIINKLNAINDLDKEYLDMQSTIYNEYGDVSTVPMLWQKYKNENRLLVEQKDGLTINPQRPFPSWREWLASKGGNVNKPTANTPAPQTAAGSPPPGMTYEQFKAWKRGQ